MYGEFGPPPGPSGNSSFFPISSSENETQELPTPSEGHGKTRKDVIQELKEDRSLNLSFRNACIKQEQIVNSMTGVLQEQGSDIDPQDVQRGVDIYLTDTMELEPNKRNRKLNQILNDLSANRGQSQYYAGILLDINALNGR